MATFLKRLFPKQQLVGLNASVSEMGDYSDDSSIGIEKMFEASFGRESQFFRTVAEDRDLQIQVSAIILFIMLLQFIRSYASERMQFMKGEHVLNLAALNDATIFYQLFLAYLSAALLDPVLAIGGMEEVKGPDLVINLFTLFSIFWWLWLLTDAFDYNDVLQYYKYHVEIGKELSEKRGDQPERYAWLRLNNSNDRKRAAKQALTGVVKIDVALWFMLACIGAAWLPGPITHRDVLHAYDVVILWAIMHHTCRKATVWSSSYFVGFLFPSTALMPLEYCLPFGDICNVVDDLDFVESYRQFIARRTGVELIIES